MVVNNNGLSDSIDLFPNKGPIIEIAKYSDVEVYECYFKGLESHIIMRRRKDDWINLTQAFKIAKFSKTRRTKILERELKVTRHEKVQGGYGRFQGTWVPIEDAKRILMKYEIDDPLTRAILNFQYDPSNPPFRRTKNSLLRRASPGTVISSPSSYNKTPKRSNSQSKKGKSGTNVNSSNTTTIQPSPLQNLTFQTPQQYNRGIAGSSFNFKRSDTMNSESTIPDYSANNHSTSKFNQQHQRDNSTNNNDNTNNIINLNINNNNNPDLIPQDDLYSTTQKPLQFFSMNTQDPSKIIENGPKLSNFFVSSNNNNEVLDKRNDGIKHSKTRKLKNSKMPFIKEGREENNANNVYGQESDHYGQIIPTVNENKLIQNQSMINVPLNEQDYKELMLKVLSTEIINNETSQMIDSLSILPSSKFDINYRIDDQGHSAIHWAAAMGNVPLVRLLLQLNANVLQCNILGFNCISKAIFYNNCYNQNVFDEIINILNICLLTPDNNGRLPLHYLVELSVNSSKDPKIMESYMDSIFKMIGTNNYDLLKTCLNYPDNYGNTVLHLAALNQNWPLCTQLCNLGSSMDLMNLNNETPASILARYDIVPISSNIPNNQPLNNFKGSIPSPPKLSINVPSPSLPLQQNQSQQLSSSVNISNNIGSSNHLADVSLAQAQIDVINDDNNKNNNNNNNNNVNATAVSRMEQLQNTSMPASTSSLDEMSTTLDSLMVSTVIKDSKQSMDSSILDQSPMMYKNKMYLDGVSNDDKKSKEKDDVSQELDLALPQLAQLMKTPKLSQLIKTPKQTNKLETVLESPELLLSSTSDKRPHNSVKDVKNQTQQLRDMTNQITYTIDRNMDTFTLKVDAIKSELRRNKQKNNSINDRRNNLLKKFDNDDNKLKDEITSLKEQIIQQKKRYFQCIEKSQALRLATLVQDEESNINNDATSPDQNDLIHQLAVELTKLQLKRKKTLKRISDNTTDYRVTEKISKYRYLIGMTIDDIDSRLDDIENDLKETK